MKGLRYDYAIHDEIGYTWRAPMKDPVYAIDAEGMVHLWWPTAKGQGYASCGLPREHVVAFQVEALATCMMCLAQEQEEASDGAALDQLERELAASLRFDTKLATYSKDDAIAVMEVMRAIDARGVVPIDPSHYGRFKEFESLP